MQQDVHDLLVIPSNKKLYRFKANSDGFAPAEQLDFYADDYRNVMNIAQTGDSVQPPRGPAFSVLPNKPDPSTSQISCFLVCSQYVRAANPWTSAPWSSEPNPKTTGLTPEERADDQELDFLVADGLGRVLRVRETAMPTEVSLDVEGEIFTQLRNGLVAGSVLYGVEGRVLPLVNISALFPPAPEDGSPEVQR